LAQARGRVLIVPVMVHDSICICDRPFRMRPLEEPQGFKGRYLSLAQDPKVPASKAGLLHLKRQILYPPAAS
jgi:hypothetical protein